MYISPPPPTVLRPPKSNPNSLKWSPCPSRGLRLAFLPLLISCHSLPHSSPASGPDLLAAPGSCQAFPTPGPLHVLLLRSILALALPWAGSASSSRSQSECHFLRELFFDFI